MDGVLLSIIIPCFNPEEMLKNTLKIISMELDDLKYEIILVDDGSRNVKPDFYSFCDEFGDNVHVFLNKKNKGANFCRRLGFRKSKGKYIIFHDCDDRFYPGRYESIKNEVLKDKYDLYLSPILYVKKQKIKMDCELICPDVVLKHPAKSLFWDRCGGTGYQTSSLVIRKTLLKPYYLPINLKGHQDWYLIIRMLSDGCVNVHIINVPSIRESVKNSGSISSGLNWKFSFLFLLNNRKYFDIKGGVGFFLFVVLGKSIRDKRMSVLLPSSLLCIISWPIYFIANKTFRKKIFRCLFK